MDGNYEPKLIGVAPWRRVEQHERMEGNVQQRGNGTIFEYTRHTHGPGPSQDIQFGLDPNHSHFILVDDDSAESQWGVEIALRSHLEDFLVSATNATSPARCSE